MAHTFNMSPYFPQHNKAESENILKTISLNKFQCLSIYLIKLFAKNDLPFLLGCKVHPSLNMIRQYFHY